MKDRTADEIEKQDKENRKKKLMVKNLSEENRLEFSDNDRKAVQVLVDKGVSP